MLVIYVSGNKHSSAGYRLSEDPHVGQLYMEYRNRTLAAHKKLLVDDIFIRLYHSDAAMKMLLLWVLGLYKNYRNSTSVINTTVRLLIRKDGFVTKQ